MSKTCASGRLTIPRMRLRVVCGTGVTIETFSPTSALTNVLLPAFGRPTTATNPDLIGTIHCLLSRLVLPHRRVTDPGRLAVRLRLPTVTLGLARIGGVLIIR